MPFQNEWVLCCVTKHSIEFLMRIDRQIEQENNLLLATSRLLNKKKLFRRSIENIVQVYDIGVRITSLQCQNECKQ